MLTPWHPGAASPMVAFPVELVTGVTGASSLDRPRWTMQMSWHPRWLRRPSGAEGSEGWSGNDGIFLSHFWAKFLIRHPQKLWFTGPWFAVWKESVFWMMLVKLPVAIMLQPAQARRRRARRPRDLLSFFFDQIHRHLTLTPLHEWKKIHQFLVFLLRHTYSTLHTFIYIYIFLWTARIVLEATIMGLELRLNL